MRVIFICYAITAAMICFLLTLGFAFSPQAFYHSYAPKIFVGAYLVFGPVLLVICILGVVFIKDLMYFCEPFVITGQINFMNLFVLVGCTILASFVTLFFSLQKLSEYACEELADSESVYYRLFFKYLTYRRS